MDPDNVYAVVRHPFGHSGSNVNAELHCKGFAELRGSGYDCDRTYPAMADLVSKGLGTSEWQRLTPCLGASDMKLLSRDIYAFEAARRRPVAGRRNCSFERDVSLCVKVDDRPGYRFIFRMPDVDTASARVKLDSAQHGSWFLMKLQAGRCQTDKKGNMDKMDAMLLVHESFYTW